MALHESVGYNSTVVLTVRRGDRVERYVYKNLVTDVGLNFIRDLLSGAATGSITHMAIGNGSATSPGSCTAPAATDTALGNELARQAVTVTNGANPGEVVFSATFQPPAGTTWSSICEAGLFDAATGGNLIARLGVGPVTLTYADSLTIDWTVTISRV